jgi:hypothetical protein
MKDGSIFNGIEFLLCLVGLGIFGLGFAVGYLVFGI